MIKNDLLSYNLYNSIKYNKLDKFFIQESFNTIQNILKQFNINIFFDIVFSNINVNLKPLNMYFKLKNKNINCDIFNYFLVLNESTLLNHIFYDKTFNLNDFYIIYKYIKNMLLKDYIFYDFIIISDNEKNVINFKYFLLKHYHIMIKCNIIDDDFLIKRKSNEKYYEIQDLSKRGN